MKTYKNLYGQIYDFDNLYAAFRQAARGKRRKESVADFEVDLEPNLWQLYEELAAQTYRPGPYHHFYIREPKRRLISAAPFRDRVVHHALCNVIEPLFDRTFIHDSYACRKGKGNHRALERCSEFARRYRYVLKGDIVKFFPSIDHAILRAMLDRRIADGHTMWLIDQILQTGAGVLEREYQMQWFPGDDLFSPHCRAGSNYTAQRSARGLVQQQSGQCPLRVPQQQRPRQHQRQQRCAVLFCPNRFPAGSIPQAGFAIIGCRTFEP